MHTYAWRDDNRRNSLHHSSGHIKRMFYCVSHRSMTIALQGSGYLCYPYVQVNCQCVLKMWWIHFRIRIQEVLHRCRCLPLGHFSVSFSHDEPKLASSSDDKTVLTFGCTVPYCMSNSFPFGFKPSHTFTVLTPELEASFVPSWFKLTERAPPLLTE